MRPLGTPNKPKTWIKWKLRPAFTCHECRRIIPDIAYVDGKWIRTRYWATYCSKDCKNKGFRVGGYNWCKIYYPQHLHLMGFPSQPNRTK